jgi:hypothetical protein
MNHSWYGKCAHIFRTDGRVVRSTLEHLLVQDGAVYIHVKFIGENGTIHTKDVSPIAIAALQILWMNVDVVSDVDIPDDEDAQFVPPPECERLPLLTVRCIPTSALLTSVVTQVNQFIQLVPSSDCSGPPPRIAQRSRRRRRDRKHVLKK